MLTSDRIAHYRDRGYVVVERLLDDDDLRDVRRVTEHIIESAHGATGHTDAFEVEDGHTPEAPLVRRIKQPHRRHGAYRALIRNEKILACLRPLLGPDIRLNDSKLNVKAPGHGSAVEWHQDWAFYPSTNQDLLAVGVMLDDVGPDNAPLMVFPGSHMGPIHDHHAGGVFRGAIAPEEAGLDLSAAVALTASAGSISLHHVRLVHGSTPNLSDRPRKLLLFECKAADAWPLLGEADWADYEQRMLCGESTLHPRVEPLPVRLPFPKAEGRVGIYELQKSGSVRSFEKPVAADS